MGLGDFLFGKDPEVTKSQEALTTPEQQAALKEVLGTARGELADTERFRTTAAPRERELSELIAGRGVESLTTGAPLRGAEQDFLMQLLGGQPRDIDEFFRATVQDPLTEQFQEDVIPGIGRQFGGRFFGSERERSEQRAREDFMETLARERTRFAFEESGRSQELGLQASQALRGREAAPDIAAAIPALAAAGRPREIEQAGFAMEADVRQQLINAILTGASQQTIENIVTQTEGGGGLLGALAPAIGGFAGSAAGSAAIASFI